MSSLTSEGGSVSPLPIQLTGLRHKENHEVLVEVVEVAGIPLVEVVGELSLAVVVGGHAAVEVHDTQRVAVKDDAKDASAGLRVTSGRSGVHLAGIGKRVASSGTLPKRDSFSIDQFGVLVMECPGLEEHISRRAELVEHDDMLEVFGRETRLPADVEQGGHPGQTTGNQRDVVGGVADEVRIEDCLGSRETLAVLLIEAVEKIDCLGGAGAGNSTAGVGAVHGFNGHIVDGAHDEVVGGNRQRLLNLVEKHGDKGVELGGAGKALLHLPLGDRAVDLESGHLVEEFRLGPRRVEDVGVVGSPILQFPALVLSSLGKLGADFFDHGAVLPRIHQNTGSRAAVRPIDKDDAADVVDERLDESVESAGVENVVAHIDNIGEILLQDRLGADGFGERGIDELIYLFDFHNCSSFLLV